MNTDMQRGTVRSGQVFISNIFADVHFPPELLEVGSTCDLILQLSEGPG